ncbi:MAG: monovalent cation/H+ antiporter subunit D [Betaproteobacteria bacterium]|nr:MAG: monovalent cation/H+ antiporter subunit D [Betaproteobacteria bacterium]
MSHLIVLPVILPAFTAVLMLLAFRNDRDRQRRVALVSTLALAATAVWLLVRAADGPQAYLVGNWPAPFGIVLVLDRLSALMLVLTAGVGLAALLYSITGWDGRGRHFHVLFQFQLLGTNGAFLTGDVFNLFVFFEVMLIASYGLVLHGGGAWRLKAGFQYVAINLVASTLFLFAVGLIYGVTGTLNMADLAVKVGQLGVGDHALLRTGALLLFTVFAVKCALVPLHWWLPATYSAAPAPAVALFAILSKVGAYSIIRVHTLVFSEDVAGVSSTLTTLLFPAAAITLVVGAIGVLASRSMLGLASYSIIGSMGTLLIGVAGLDPRQLSAALYYLVHSTLIGAALFLLVDVIAASRGRIADRIARGRISHARVLGGLYLITAVAAVGLPPLSGFVGKIAILDSFRGGSVTVVAWSIILATSLLLLVGYARAGSTLFWMPAPSQIGRADARTFPATSVAVIAGLLLSTAVLSVFGGSVLALTAATVDEILTPASYIQAVGPALTQPGP